MQLHRGSYAHVVPTQRIASRSILDVEDTRDAVIPKYLSRRRLVHAYSIFARDG
jgi:hypothetical protein